MKTFAIKKIAICSLLLSVVSIYAEDWPSHMHDNRRSGVSTEELDFSRLQSAWQMLSPVPQHTAWSGPAPWDAWRDDDPLDALRNFDDAPFVTVVGNQVFVGSSTTDSAYALDRLTGEVQWMYITDGPVRFPPAYADGKVYFGSDDGYVYCLNAEDGAFEWKYTPVAEADRRLVGNNGNLIPFWPVRTGVAIEGGRVYFASSLASWKTTYLCALDAATGTEQYKVDGSATPMGSIMVAGDLIYLMQGRLSPTLFNRSTGAYLGVFGGMTTYRTDDCGAYALVTVDGDLITNYDNRGDMGVKTWSQGTELLASYAEANHVVADDTTLYVATGSALSAMGSGGTTSLWSVVSSTSFSLIKSGSALIAGGNNEVVAFNSTDGSQLWSHQVTGRVCGLAVSGGMLFASTDEGHVFAFRTSDTAISTTAGATGITTASATLQGEVDSASQTTHHIRLFWGTSDPGATDAGWDHVENLGTRTNGQLASAVGGLLADRTYYYRYAVSNAATSAWVFAPTAAFFLTGELTLSVSPANLSEEIPTPGTITIRRPAGTEGEALSVGYSISGTATEGTDYGMLSGTATFAAGETETQVEVVPVDDLEMGEPLETVLIGLDAGSFLLGASDSVELTITDNDALDPSGYRYQAKIGFPGYTQAETLNDFPALVVFEEGRGGFSYAQCAPGGGDLRFTSPLRDRLLSYEVEDWNPSGTSYVWVKVPLLEDSTSFVRAYWGHATQTTGQVLSESTWDNGFIGVWHLDESAGLRMDSSPCARTGTPSGVTSQSGILLGAMEVGSGQYLDAGGNGTGSVPAVRLGLPTSGITVEAWVNLDTVVSGSAAMSFVQDNGSVENGWALGTFSTQSFFALTAARGGLTYLKDPGAPALNQWVYMAGTYDGNTMRIYVDGQQVSSSTMEKGYINYQDSWLRLGMYKDDNEAVSMDGTLDEERLSSIARSADWIWATWKSIADPAGFSSMDDLYADTDADGMEDEWEISTFGDMITAGSTTDWDGDGMGDALEFRAGTDPKDPASLLEGSLAPAGTEEIDIHWHSKEGRVYFIEESTNLPSQTWNRILDDIEGTGSMTTVSVDIAEQPAAYYKVGLDYDPAQ